MEIEVDYIVVGLGLAGVSFCEQLRENNKTFLVFNDDSQKSSIVASGLYNPVVLKRFTGIWKGDEQLKLALEYYRNIEKLLDLKLDEKISVYRKFASVEEQNNWFEASDKPKLRKYLSASIIKNTNKNVIAPFGFGKVLHTGRLKVKTLLNAYKAYLKNKHLIYLESFIYKDLKHNNKDVLYKNIKGKHIVFAEGFGVVKNPFFTNLNLSPTKGELLTIYAPKLNIDYILKGSVFLIPIGNNLYVVGATYELNDLTHDITEKAKLKLLEGLKSMISCPFKIVNHVVGIRPTVRDRRPLVGRHKNYQNIYVLNGLGTRGVLIGPYVAKQLYKFVENGIPLEKEIDISRFN